MADIKYAENAADGAGFLYCEAGLGQKNF